MNYLSRLAIIGTLALSACSPQGYTGKCADAVADAKVTFMRTCSTKKDSTLYNGELEKITQERDLALQAAGCELRCERWICGRSSYASPMEFSAGRYKPRVEKQITCP